MARTCEDLLWAGILGGRDGMTAWLRADLFQSPAAVGELASSSVGWGGDSR